MLAPLLRPEAGEYIYNSYEVHMLPVLGHNPTILCLVESLSVVSEGGVGLTVIPGFYLFLGLRLGHLTLVVVSIGISSVVSEVLRVFRSVMYTH
jgi:hypothetical protein